MIAQIRKPGTFVEGVGSEDDDEPWRLFTMIEAAIGLLHEANAALLLFQEDLRADARAIQAVDAGTWPKPERDFGDGPVPSAITGASAGIHARAFVMAIHTLAELLDDFDREGVEGAGRRAVEIILAAGPARFDVRHSVHHRAERLQGKNRKGPIPDLAGVITDNIAGNSYTVLDVNGSQASFPVTDEMLAACADAVQLVVDSVTWTGPEFVVP